MARFRFHRGGLAESLATQIKVRNLKDVEKASNGQYPKESPFIVKDLKCEYYGKDDRQGAYPQTYLITARNEYEPRERFVLGMSDAMLEYPERHKFMAFIKRLFRR